MNCKKSELVLLWELFKLSNEEDKTLALTNDFNSETLFTSIVVVVLLDVWPANLKLAVSDFLNVV